MKAFKSNLKDAVTKYKGHKTHEQISEETGIRRVTITRWMNNKPFQRLDIRVLNPLSTWLGCEIEDLYEVVDVAEESDPEMAVA